MNTQVVFFLENEYLETLAGVPLIPRVGERVMIREEYATVCEVGGKPGYVQNGTRCKVLLRYLQ